MVQFSYRPPKSESLLFYSENDFLFATVVYHLFVYIPVPAGIIRVLRLFLTSSRLSCEGYLYIISDIVSQVKQASHTPLLNRDPPLHAWYTAVFFSASYIYIYSYPRNAYTRTHGVSDVRFVLALCAKPVAYYWLLADAVTRCSLAGCDVELLPGTWYHTVYTYDKYSNQTRTYKICFEVYTPEYIRSWWGLLAVLDTTYVLRIRIHLQQLLCRTGITFLKPSTCGVYVYLGTFVLVLIL